MRVDEENAKHYNKLSVLSMTKMRMRGRSSYLIRLITSFKDDHSQRWNGDRERMLFTMHGNGRGYDAAKISLSAAAVFL